jgi:amyloid beta precursor protein binding protein 1
MQAKEMENPEDLRMNSPFPALLELADSYDFETMDSAEHSHVPFVVILLRVMNKWKTERGGEAPKNFAEKEEFKVMITGMARDYCKEECYNEAFNNAWKINMKDEIPYEIEQMLESDTCKEPKNSFWLLIAALKEFVNKYHTLPVSGKIPDMTSKSEYYIDLQKVY